MAEAPVHVPVQQIRETAELMNRAAEELAVRVRYLAHLTATLQEDWRGPAADAFSYECRQGLDAMTLVLELPRELGRRLQFLADRLAPP